MDLTSAAAAAGALAQTRKASRGGHYICVDGSDRLEAANQLWQRRHLLETFLRAGLKAHSMGAPWAALVLLGKGWSDQPPIRRIRQRQRTCGFSRVHGAGRTARAKAGCKRGVLKNVEDLPSEVKTTPPRRNDCAALCLLINMPPIADEGRPSTKRNMLDGGTGYRHAALRALVGWLRSRHLLAPVQQEPHSPTV